MNNFTTAQRILLGLTDGLWPEGVHEVEVDGARERTAVHVLESALQPQRHAYGRRRRLLVRQYRAPWRTRLYSVMFIMVNGFLAMVFFCRYNLTFCTQTTYL